MTPTPTTLGPDNSVTGAASVWTGRREARLRHEHAHRYPDLRAGQWESAATVADRVLAGSLLRGRETSLWVRLLQEEHFEFRGAGAGFVPNEGRRPRREDR